MSDLSTGPKAKKFLVTSSYFPPVIGGTSTIMTHLLAAFKPDSFAVLSESTGSFDGTHMAPVPPEMDISRIGVPGFITHKIPYGTRITRYLRFALIPVIERKIYKTARRIQAERILAVYPSWPFLIASYRAALRLKIPLITYYMDVSVDPSRLRWPDRPAVKHYERKLLEMASERLALSEALADDFKDRFGLGSAIVRHSIDLKKLSKMETIPLFPQWKDKKWIVHTGVVEESLQREGLRRIAQVVDQHPEWNAKLILATPTAKADLLASGFNLPCVEIVSLKPAEAIALQRQSAVLLAVLPFQGKVRSFQQTAFPTKGIEYMASGVPILAHTPPDSFFARHVRQYQYAYLADTEDTTELTNALNRLMNDQGLRDQLTERASDTVKNIFDLPKVAQQFVNACGLDQSVLKPV